MTDTVAVDWTDPCAKAAALRAAYYRMVSGDLESEIRTRTLDGEEMVRFQPGDIDALRSDLASAEADCAAKQAIGSTPPFPKRFAITARHVRRSHPFRTCR